MFLWLSCILQGLILDAPGCKEAKVSSATVWLWFLYAVLSWCQEPGCAQVILGATCQEKWSQKKWPKKALFEIRPGASQANKNIGLGRCACLQQWAFHPKNNRVHVLCGFPCILQGLQLPYNGLTTASQLAYNWLTTALKLALQLPYNCLTLALHWLTLALQLP